MAAPDTAELSALLARYERPLVRYAQSITGDVDSARDVVQETFIKLARGGMREDRRSDVGSGNGNEDYNVEHVLTSDLRPPSSHAEAWLFTVTRHRALDHHRKFSRIIPMPFPADRPCGAPGPAAVLERREAATSLFALLDQLTANQREVIRLKFQNDLSYREIADLTQLSVTNVGFLLHTGLKKLRALISEQPSEDFGLEKLRSVL